MSYRGETDILDFDDWSVACITGDNGNGKSAILEAITWVLWGKTRVQRSKDLISKGEEGMFAEFEFNIDYLTSDSEIVFHERRQPALRASLLLVLRRIVV